MKRSFGCASLQKTLHSSRQIFLKDFVPCFAPAYRYLRPRLQPQSRSPRLHKSSYFTEAPERNPVPGGTRAVFVRAIRSVDEVSIKWKSTILLWSSTTSHDPPAMTNYQAEYKSLLPGLEAAWALRLPVLEAIGHSALILHQLRTQRQPRNWTLRSLYLQPRKQADWLGICKPIYHLRDHKNMADSLVNHAMDTHASTQVPHPTSSPGHTDLHTMLDNGLRQWWSHTTREMEL